MDAVPMDFLRQEGQILRDVKMQLPAKMLLGVVVLIWYTLHMVQIKKVAVYLPNSDVAQTTTRFAVRTQRLSQSRAFSLLSEDKKDIPSSINSISGLNWMAVTRFNNSFSPPDKKPGFISGLIESGRRSNPH